jgi:hypothetical protein
MKWFRYIVEEDEEKTVWMDWNWNIHKEGDDPAVIWKDGTLVYYKNGVKHREGSPSVVFLDGHEEWWFQGKLHRIGGPSITTSDGRIYFYIFGEEFTEDKYQKEIQKYESTK